MTGNPRPLILLGLNELNFDSVRAYALEGKLPHFKQLLEHHTVLKTTSEKKYHELEPWIQWVSIQTGKPFEEHGIFRLGDVADSGHAQIWEHLENSYRIKVAAVSPMNAANRCREPAFFVPDPWTETRITGDWLLAKLSKAVVNAVNENATGGSGLSTYLYLLLGALRYSLAGRHVRLATQIVKSLKTRYQRAILLDQLLTDAFAWHWKKSRPDFSSLFLNSGAHIQHHYMFNSAHYNGPNKNPDWYMPHGQDPVLQSYRNYDAIAAQILALPGKPRVLIATGLHQIPVERPVFYWRLKRHSDFLNLLGIVHTHVAPRMSRDFLIAFENPAQRDIAEKRLRSCTDQAGQRLFEEIEARDESLFVTLTYPHEITKGFIVKFEGGELRDFYDMVAFVALKNGEHDGLGYLIDSDDSAAKTGTCPVTDIFNLIDQHFAQTKTVQKAA